MSVLRILPKRTTAPKSKAKTQQNKSETKARKCTHREGLGAPHDLGLAVEWFREAAVYGDLDAINNLAQMNEVGEGVQQNLQLAMQLYHTAANAGHLDGMTNLG